MNYFLLVDGNLVCIGNFGDWEAAHEVALDLFGENWIWLEDEIGVSQWVRCFKQNRSQV